MNAQTYRNDLPQLAGKMCITDGGLETVFVFQKNVDLPLFASIDLLTTAEGQKMLVEYFQPYVDLARERRVGLILDTATWRASHGWAEQLGHSRDDIRRLNQLSVDLLNDIRTAYESAETPMVINGVIGPESDGYNPTHRLGADEAEAYHTDQVMTFAESAADMVTAVTMTYADEAVGIVQASRKAGIPVAVSFTVETDGRLPDGTTLREAIETVDFATTNGPAYYMINCAHPSHFEDVLDNGADWTNRIRGIRANASRKSHAELDESTELDDGDPVEFGDDYLRLCGVLKNLTVVGGCCGTDHRHVSEVCRAVA
ncbi:MAG: homocysteine S-methyltransferase family protein [Pseudomonadota bacterium]